MPVGDDGRHVPDKVMTRCQCVWDHHDITFWRTIAQCTGRRDPFGNIYCEGCQEAHTEVSERMERDAQRKESR